MYEPCRCFSEGLPWSKVFLEMGSTSQLVPGLRCCTQAKSLNKKLIMWSPWRDCSRAFLLGPNTLFTDNSLWEVMWRILIRLSWALTGRWHQTRVETRLQEWVEQCDKIQAEVTTPRCNGDLQRMLGGVWSVGNIKRDWQQMAVSPWWDSWYIAP